jgi:hypothetical protein
MAIDAFQPDGAVAHGGIQFGGGGEAAQAPCFLIPAAADDPGAARIFGGIGGDLGLGLGQRMRVRQVQRQGVEADAHHMGMGVDQAGHHHRIMAVGEEIELVGALVAIAQQLLDPALLVDDQTGEVLDLALHPA